MTIGVDERPPDRTCTNVIWIIFCSAFVISTLGTVTYSALEGDVNRLFHGYDDCGYICGQKNPTNDVPIPAKEKVCNNTDKTKLPKLKILTKLNQGDMYFFECVEKCPDGVNETFNRCGLDSKTDFIHEISEELLENWHYILDVIMIAFIFSYVVLILFRYAIKYIIWIIYSSFVVVMGGCAIFFWVKSALEGGKNANHLVLAGAFSVFAFVAIILLCCLRRRIKLVAKLFKEASKALMDVPAILFEPILTFIALLLAFIVFIFFFVLIGTAGELKLYETERMKIARFTPDTIMKTAAILNVLAFVWFTQFIFGCQHFVIAGTISKWYFTRDKTKLISPISRSFTHLLKFHLGSICFGSTLMTIIKILKWTVFVIQKKLKGSENVVFKFFACCCSFIMKWLEKLVEYFMSNAYILVAKDGTPLIKSGKRASELLTKNLLEVLALNNFGDFVLIIGQVFIIAISGFVGYELMSTSVNNKFIYSLVLSIVIAYFIAYCFVSVFEMTVDTIFLCFCVDYEENGHDGREYFMSDGLLKVMFKLKGISPEPLQSEDENSEEEDAEL